LSAKILLLDIETAPGLGYAWESYETNIIEWERSWYMLCFGYQWYGEGHVTVKALPDYSRYEHSRVDDYYLVRDLHSVLDAADIVVAHNGDSFDIKKSNARFAIHDLSPPSTYKTVDTLKIARKHFKFESNKLTSLGKYFGLGEKLTTTGWKLWKGCMAGDADCWRQMKEYNAQDVTLLGELYTKLRPWSTNHPNLGLYGDATACPTCQSKDTQRRGYAYAKTNKYQRFHCQGCGSWFQGKLEKDKK
jgi:uncharacterized protein YprB with RNaseH-like and TPR domain